MTIKVNNRKQSEAAAAEKSAAAAFYYSRFYASFKLCMERVLHRSVSQISTAADGAMWASHPTSVRNTDNLRFILHAAVNPSITVQSRHLHLHKGCFQDSTNQGSPCWPRGSIAFRRLRGSESPNLHLLPSTLPSCLAAIHLPLHRGGFFMEQCNHFAKNSST